MNKEKEYFLKDEVISCKEDDYFRHEDIANNIVNIIKTKKMPYNIALIGKWGTGKSSTIELVKRKLNNPEKYKFAEINVWKYEKEELKRTLLKQTFEAIDGCKEQDIIKEELKKITDITIKQESNKSEKSFGEFFKKSLLPIIIFGLEAGIVFLIISIIYLLGYLILLLIKGNEVILTEYLENYIKSNFLSKAIISFLAPLIKELIDGYKEKGLNRWRIGYPKKGTDEYEDLLKKHLKLFNKNVIIVLDDIDRLTTPKIVEALDAIKAFAEFEKVIFIVPFDDNILKKALGASQKEYSADTLMVQSELFLDKLFQFKIYMPPLPDYDIKEYTYNLCNEKCKELKEICGEDFNEIINEILIHPNVSNPRQVKKILNNFLNNILIAKARDDVKLEKGLLTSREGVKIIAKISVLQCDFNEFYDELLNDFELINKLLEFYNNTDKEKIFPKNLSRIENYFNGNKLKEQYLPLVNYLILTSSINNENLAPYIYMSQDKLGIEIGDAKQKQIKQALESKNIINIKELIETDLENVKKVMKYYLQNSQININAINTIINCMGFLPKDFIIDVSEELIKKINNLHTNNKISNYLEYDINNIIVLYRVSNYNDLVEKILIHCIDKNLKENQDKTNIINCLIKNSEDIGTGLKVKIKEVIGSVFSGFIKEYTIEDFIKNLPAEDFDINYYLELKQYTELCRYIEENEFYDEKALELLVSLSKTSEKNKKYDEYLKDIINWINIDELIETMKNIVVNNMPKKMSIKISNEIICAINTELLNNKIDSIICIIENINFQIDDKNKTIMDDKITEIEGKDYIDEIIKSISIKNEIQYLENLSKSISKQLVEGQAYHEIMDDILKSYSTVQLEYINTLIKPLYTSTSAINEKEIESVIQVSKALIKNNLLEEKMKSNLEAGVRTLRNYYNIKIWANWMIEIIGENISIISDENLQEYVKLICKLIKEISYQDFAIRAVEFLSDKISGHNLDIIIETMLEQEIDIEENYILLENLIKNSETDYYPDYISLVIKQINNDNYQELNSILVNNVEYIDEKSFINAINCLEIENFKLAIQIIEKLYQQNNTNTAKNLLNICEDYEKLILIGEKIFINVDVLNNISINEINLSKGMNNYLKLLIENNCEKERVYNTINYLLENIEESELIETLNIIKEIKKIYYPKRREKINLSEWLYNVFCNTTSNQIKKEICIIIKQLGMREQFLRKEFNDSEKEILSEI